MASPSAGEPRGAAAQKNTADSSRATRLRLTWILGILLVVALGAVGVAAQQKPDASNGPSPVAPAAGAADASPPPSDAQQEETPGLSQLARRDPADAAAKGERNAPVVIIEYADFRCAYCAVFANEVLPIVMTEYVDAGLVRIEWRDAPVLGKTSSNAAIAAHAAGAQGLFWEYSAALYATDPTGGTVWDLGALTAVADSVAGLDVPAFTTALEDPAHAQRVASDLQEAQTIGVTGTPTFIVGNTPVQGAQPLEVFREVIERELAAATE